MRADFNIQGIKTEAWLSISGWRSDATFDEERDEDGRDIYHDITPDENGALKFEFKGETHYLHDMAKISMAELAEMVKKQYDENKQPDGRCFHHYIQEKLFIVAMLCDGPWNTRFQVEMPVADIVIPFMGIGIVGDNKIALPCKLKKSFNSEPHGGYKLEFEVDIDMVPPEAREQLSFVCPKRTYTSDIWSMIQSNIIGILPSVDDGKTPEQHIDEYFAEYIKEDS